MFSTGAGLLVLCDMGVNDSNSKALHLTLDCPQLVKKIIHCVRFYKYLNFHTIIYITAVALPYNSHKWSALYHITLSWVMVMFLLFMLQQNCMIYCLCECPSHCHSFVCWLFLKSSPSSIFVVVVVCVWNCNIWLEYNTLLWLILYLNFLLSTRAYITQLIFVTWHTQRGLLIFTAHSAKENTIHQVTTMLQATSKNVLFPGHNHMLTTGADDLTVWLSPKRQQVVMTWK